MPADHTAALNSNRRNDQWNLIGTLERLIESSTSSVDLCIYDLEHPRIGHALLRAKERGVRVRVVTDNHKRTDSREIDHAMWQILRRGGIVSIAVFIIDTKVMAPSGPRRLKKGQWQHP